MSRGFSCVGLWSPRHAENVGGVMRACGVYGASSVWIFGSDRMSSLMKHPSDTMKAWRHIPVIGSKYVETPYDCRLVAVEIVPDARDLPSYTHPERAMYLFGPESGSIPDDLIAAADDVVWIPTQRCMNLAATVNVVLYDRLAKERTNAEP